VKKLTIIAVLLAMMTAAFAQIQPESFFTPSKLAGYTGISTDKIVVSGHRQTIQKKHSHRNGAKSRILSNFAAEEDNNEITVNSTDIQNVSPALESGISGCGIYNETTYKVKANLTILKTRK
jgi:hypothetical protein